MELGTYSGCLVGLGLTDSPNGDYQPSQQTTAELNFH